MTSSPSLLWSDSEDDFANISRNLFQRSNVSVPIPLSTPHQNQDDLPPSSPPRESPLSSPPRDTPATPNQPEETSPGPFLSSIIRGTRQERGAHRRRKGYKKQRETLAQQRQEAVKQRNINLDAVLDCLHSKGLRFLDLMEYVFDYSNGRGDIRWHDFFVQEGVATRILNLWASSRNAQGAREEVEGWAIEYIARTVTCEARSVTKSKKIQTLGKKIDQKIITSFRLSDMHDLLQDEMAPVAMTIFKAFSTSRHAHKHTEQRKEKTSLVSQLILKFKTCLTADILRLSHRQHYHV